MRIWFLFLLKKNLHDNTKYKNNIYDACNGFAHIVSPSGAAVPMYEACCGGSLQ